MSDYSRELQIADIIARKQLGTASSEDMAVLEAWIGESDGNREFYEKAIGKESLENSESMARNANPDESYEGIRKEIRRRKRIFAARVSSAAAVLLIGAFSFYFFSDSDRDMEILNKELLSDRTQAVLSLPDGRQVELTNDDDDTAWKDYANDEEVARDETAVPANIKIDIPRGGEYKVKLDDGTVVWLNSESSLEYPQRFTGGKRVVKISGEAYFEVLRDEQKPFTVVAGNTEIVVLGTSFNVTAYDDSGTVTTTLVSGSVEVATPFNSVTLAPGDQATVTGTGADIAVTQVNPSLYSSWASGVFDFEKMELVEICARLSRWYDVEFVFEGNTAKEKFTGGAWKNAPLGEFLSNIELVTDVVFKAKEGKIVVTPKK